MAVKNRVPNEKNIPGIEIRNLGVTVCLKGDCAELSAAAPVT